MSVTSFPSGAVIVLLHFRPALYNPLVGDPSIMVPDAALLTAVDAP